MLARILVVDDTDILVLDSPYTRIDSYMTLIVEEALRNKQN